MKRKKYTRTRKPMKNVILIVFYGIPLKAIFIIHIFTYKLYKTQIIAY